MSEQNPFVTSRRNILRAASAGFGYLALAGLLGSIAQKAAAQELNANNPLAPKRPPLPAKAKRIILLFMEGAMSSLDTFEYKPEMIKQDGKSGPGGTVMMLHSYLLNSLVKSERAHEMVSWAYEAQTRGSA
ncbi:MAG: DUF1501 domain-containing protein [Terracidiphilus sp.]|jgi:hypothetical protein